MNINRNYLELKDSYLFSGIAEKVREHQLLNPDRAIISLGIGDITRPICPTVITAMQSAVTEMGNASTFHGYGPEQGYPFLREAISASYAKKGVAIDVEEIFVGDGAKSDLGNILDLFSSDNTVLIPDPVYPVYVDTNIMDGRTIIHTKGTIDNEFLPLPDPSTKADLIYLCSPNNPTGAVYSKEQLAEWVKYAQDNDAVILFDCAYESFIQDSALPTSIYQVEGAQECAIEFCSFSKTAGFTGLRCGYTVVPRALVRDGHRLNKLWLRRQTTKFNGVSYVVQRGAEATFSDAGRKELQENIAYYQENARLISEALEKKGIWFTGGKNAPYIWFKCPDAMTSWEFFDYLLNKEALVGTPGSGFGEAGEGFFRLTAFGKREEVIQALERLGNI